MSRTFIEKTYHGEIPRPSVEVTRWENDHFLMAATPWGNKDAHKHISTSFSEFLTASMADREATSPFAKLPTLSPLANSLRAATLYANEKAFKACNSEAFSSACEALVIAFENSEMVWVQVGQPHLFLIRNGRLIPLEVAIDLSVDYEAPTPLPSRLLAIDSQIDFAVKSLVLAPEDKLILLARSTIPDSLFNTKLSGSGEDILKSLFNAAANAAPKTPFWISFFG